MASQAIFSDKDKFQATEGFLSEILRERGKIGVSENVQTPNVAAILIGSTIGAVNVIFIDVGVSYWPRIDAISSTNALGRAVIVQASPLEKRFEEQADKWSRETVHLSSPTQMMLHPSYQAIMGMAREDEQGLIRLMLRDLRDNRRLWFWALSYLTNDNPIKPTDAGKLNKMIDAWVKWGTVRGLL